MVADSAERCCETQPRRQTQPATLTTAAATSSITAEHPMAGNGDIGLPADDKWNLNAVYQCIDGCPEG
jgi:hypothetical protein